MRTKLTPREKEVAELLKYGYTNKQVGEKLNITTRTAERHRENIYEKHGVNDRRQLVALMSSVNDNLVLKIRKYVIHGIENPDVTTVMIGDIT